MFTRKKFLNIFFATVFNFIFLFFLNLYFVTSNVPSQFFMTRGIEQKVINDVPVSLMTVQNNKGIKIKVKNKAVYVNSKKIGKYNGTINLFGVVPIKRVMFTVMPEIKVIPGGNAIGIKIYNKGVIIIDTCNVRNSNIADKYDLKIGDIIVKVNSKNINSSNELVKDILNSKGHTLKFEIKRKDKLISKIVKPAYDTNSKQYKLGIWVRDKTAGIGTLTFYNPKNGCYAALGHPIMDIDSGKLFDVKKGYILKSKILSVKKGTNGDPGELEGIFENENEPIGTVLTNNECGIYGKIFDDGINNKKMVPVAYSNEVKEGPASILCTTDDNKVNEYSINILKINRNFKDTTKNMIIQITDKRLLEKTGGIVQGMSGSPILQNGKLIGAVTHVFVNDSTKGFGIFSELMIDKLQQVN